MDGWNRPSEENEHGCDHRLRQNTHAPMEVLHGRHNSRLRLHLIQPRRAAPIEEISVFSMDMALPVGARMAAARQA